MLLTISKLPNARALFQTEVDNKDPRHLRTAVTRAIAAGVRLSGANLSGANLSSADLTDVDLSDTDLRDINLANANLTRANLRGANLRGGNLRGGNLRGANLRGANLRHAILDGADLADADLADADLADADLYNVQSLFHARGLPEIPCIEQLDVKVLAWIEATPAQFNMSAWTSQNECGTTYCRAGLAVHLAGDAGMALQRARGWEAAGGLIYQKSTGDLPNFRATNGSALDDIQRCAKQQLQLQPGGSLK